MYECLRVPINKTSDIDEVVKAIGVQAMEQKAKNGRASYPYKYIAIDTLDKLEDYVEAEQTVLYNAKQTNPTAKVTSVAELAYGAGYGMIREGVKARIDQLARVCKHLILICHVKDKYLESKGTLEVTEKDLALSGKLGGIVSAKADAIGYMVRNAQGVLRVSFKSTGNTIRGARFAHLANQEFDFNWDRIFLPDTLSADTAETP
jgi:hypothetical protein